MEEILQATSTFGFPVAVAAYLLFRFEGKVEKLNDNIAGKDGLVDKIETLTQVIIDLKNTLGKRRK